MVEVLAHHIVHNSSDQVSHQENREREKDNEFKGLIKMLLWSDFLNETV